MEWFKKKTHITEKPSTMEIGSAGSNLYGGGKIQKYNPDVLLQKKGLNVYAKMKADDQVKSVLLFKKLAVVSRKYFFDAENVEEEKRESFQEMAEFFDFVVKKIKGSFTVNMTNILSALENGFSITEKVYMPLDYKGKTMWGIKDLKLLPADTFYGGFVTDEHDNILEIRQEAVTENILIPKDKIIHFVYQSDIDVHYGESDLRACYRAWWSKNICIKFHNIYLERLAGGFIYAKQKGQLDSQQKLNLQNILKNITARMGAIVPDQLVELAKFDPVNTDAYEKAIAIHDKAIAKSLLIPNLLGISEQGSTGSFAQSKIQKETFFWVLDALSGQLAEILNEQVFKKIALWNYGVEDFPQFTFQPISDERKVEIAKAWSELVRGGSVTKSDTDEAYLRNLMGFPKKEEAEPDPEPDPDKFTQEKPWLKRTDFAKIGKSLDDQDAKFKKEMADILARARVSIEKQIIKIGGEKSFGNIKPKEIEDVGIPNTILSSLKKLIRKNLQETLDTNYEQAAKELPVKPHKIIQPGMDITQAEKFLASKSMKIAGVIDTDLLKAVQNILENAIKYDKTLAHTIAAISEDTTLASMLPEIDAAGRAINIPVRIENIVRTNTSEALNLARQSLFRSPELKGFVLAYEYSAILDDRVTDFCETMNGRIRKDWGSSTPPNHFMCRSLLIPVTVVDDWSGKEDSLPNIKPAKGFY